MNVVKIKTVIEECDIVSCINDAVNHVKHCFHTDDPDPFYEIEIEPKSLIGTDLIVNVIVNIEGIRDGYYLEDDGDQIIESDWKEILEDIQNILHDFNLIIDIHSLKIFCATWFIERELKKPITGIDVSFEVLVPEFELFE